MGLGRCDQLLASCKAWRGKFSRLKFLDAGGAMFFCGRWKAPIRVGRGRHEQEPFFLIDDDAFVARALAAGR